jgi:hypothetical protein
MSTANCKGVFSSLQFSETSGVDSDPHPVGGSEFSACADLDPDPGLTCM